jgi:integrase
MRRGELLALRWRDIDLARSTIAIRRSAGPIHRKGQGARVREADTKNKQPRVANHRYQYTPSPPSRSAWASATLPGEGSRLQTACKT